ncbi:MAG: aryl-sulfate sulfotransferase [bacterium]|nr:aryl-sulfate sulfotransferase [bacterium]
MARQSAAVSDKFLLQHKGSRFAAELGSNGCVVNGDNADFTPNWDGFDETLADVAFAFYRLSYDPLDTPLDLTVEWDGAIPTDGECWIGLSDWTGDRWSWNALPSGGVLPIADPTKFADGSQHAFVAVLMIGTRALSLSSIGFGELPVFPANEGYTLFAPMNTKDTYLLDMAGSIVHTWTANYTPGAAAELLPNGHLLRLANLGNATFSNGGGRGGRLTEFDWDGNVVWTYDLSNSTQVTHHDFCVLPNGNVLLIVWNVVSDADMIQAGRDPANIDPGKFWVDTVIEVEPTLPYGGNIVWEWDVMDHLVQDFDATKDNFGDPQANHQLMDANYPPKVAGDWTHFNCITYNAALDQVMLTTPFFNEIWIIDHSTTTIEAGGHLGGQYGRGGDLLYRWGNPLVYRQGTAADQQLFFCHDGHWIPDGLDGAGDVLVFNNRAGSPESEVYSAVDQLSLPLNPDGSYFLTAGVYGPTAPVERYTSTPKEDFYSAIMSSGQRLPGGGLLICAGASGYLFETDADGNVLWEYENPFPTLNSPVFQALRYGYDYPGVEDLL